MLADAIKEAKRNNVPKDNIARAIKRAVDGSQGDFKEVVYEVRCNYTINATDAGTFNMSTSYQ